jgi:RNA polymerase sigma-70 factor (ECF subfamily)
LGDLILLGDQDRSRWDGAQIRDGLALVEKALLSSPRGRYSLQAAIAAVHAEAATAEATDWEQIVGLYDLLILTDSSPVIELNRAASLAMRDGPEAGLVLIDRVLESSDLETYHLAHSARAELCRRLGRVREARAYERAISFAKQEPERRFLKGKLESLYAGMAPGEKEVD